MARSEPKCLAKPPLLQHPEPSTYLSASTRYFYAKYRLLLQNFTESSEVWGDAVDRWLKSIGAVSWGRLNSSKKYQVR